MPTIVTAHAYIPSDTRDQFWLNSEADVRFSVSYKRPLPRPIGEERPGERHGHRLNMAGHSDFSIGSLLGLRQDRNSTALTHGYDTIMDHSRDLSRNFADDVTSTPIGRQAPSTTSGTPSADTSCPYSPLSRGRAGDNNIMK